MSRIVVSDPTLRDGNHAIGHSLTEDNVVAYCRAGEAAGIPIIEVGHGNGIGASSLQVGLAMRPDLSLLAAARDALENTLLGIHAAPGFATIERDIAPAIEIGVDVVRVASHCTEANTMRKHIEFARLKGRRVYANLMCCHMVPKEVLLAEAEKAQGYGADGLILMDSAGAVLPDWVTDTVTLLRDRLTIAVGFHGHNNLSHAVANSIAAVRAGATIVDGTIMGFGAGAGNAQLEVMVAVLHRLGFETGIDIQKVPMLIQAAQAFAKPPTISFASLASGLSGVVSAFAKHVHRHAVDYDVREWDIYAELGRRGVVAGQEDQILEVAQSLQARRA